LMGWACALAACDEAGKPPPDERDATTSDTTTATSGDATGDARDGYYAVQTPGRVVWRRLNRLEYRNTVHDLLHSDLDPGADLPADDTGYGFDNIASVLTLSPLHLELYERAARIVTSDVLRPPVTAPTRYVVEGEAAESTVEYGSVIDGVYLMGSGGTLTGHVTVARGGSYTYTLRGYETHGGDEAAKLTLWLDGAPLTTFDMSETAADYTVQVQLDAGVHALQVEYSNDFYDPPADRNAWVDWFALDGPAELDVYDQTPWSRVVVCTPDALDRACARATVAELAPRAWRHPVDDATLDSLMGLYDDAIAGGAPAAEALGLPIQALLLSPRFVFKVEGDGPLDGYAIATRLAYFIWSTMPDDLLLSDAAAGKLDTPAGISDEVARMLADPKAEALVQSYGGQWLYIRDVANVFPDPNIFAEFDEPLRVAMVEELQRFFRSFVFEDRSLLELLTSHESWMNRRLAEHYGLEARGPATDDQWARVSLEGTGRQGLLTQAGLLTALSTPFRTSIVRRGKWVLTQLLCDEPPPPPPGVQGLLETDPSGVAHTLREKMELHLTREDCKTCHESMDAVGFALEGFDGIGRTRTSDNGYPLDLSATLGDTSFHGAQELSDLLAQDPRLPRCAVSKLMTYALGRGLKGSDDQALDQAAAAFVASDYRFAKLVAIVATSAPFRARDPETGGNP